MKGKHPVKRSKLSGRTSKGGEALGAICNLATAGHFRGLQE
jgi:hypothetical protein